MQPPLVAPDQLVRLRTQRGELVALRQARGRRARRGRRERSERVSVSATAPLDQRRGRGHALLRFDERFDLGLQPAGQQRELERRRRRVEGIDGAFLFIFRRGLRAGEGSSSRKRVGGVHRRVASLCLLQPERRRGDEVKMEMMMFVTFVFRIDPKNSSNNIEI